MTGSTVWSVVIGVLSAADASVIVALIAMIATPTIIAIKNTRQLNRVERSVNHVGVGEPTLIQMVRDAQADSHEFRVWTHDAMVRIAAEVGAHLPDMPAERLKEAPHDPR